MRISVIDPVTVNREQSMGSAGPVQYTHSFSLGVADVVAGQATTSSLTPGHLSAQWLKQRNSLVGILLRMV